MYSVQYTCAVLVDALHFSTSVANEYILKAPAGKHMAVWDLQNSKQRGNACKIFVVVAEVVKSKTK
jgi:hypothetical protein